MDLPKIRAQLLRSPNLGEEGGKQIQCVVLDANKIVSVEGNLIGSVF